MSSGAYGGDYYEPPFNQKDSATDIEITTVDGDGPTPKIVLKTGDAAVDESGNIELATGDSVNASGAMLFATGATSAAGQNSGGYSFLTGQANGAGSDSGSFQLFTGQSVNGGNSGIIQLLTGVSSSGDSGQVAIGSGVAGAQTSGNAAFFSGNAGQQSGTARLFSGIISFGGVKTGDVQVYSGDSVNALSGNVEIWTGDATLGAGSSGSISLTVGSAPGTQGEIKFLKSGVAPTIGDVWTATAVDGTGYWAALDAANKTLSNLDNPTSINRSLLPGGGFAIGSNSLPWTGVFSGSNNFNNGGFTLRDTNASLNKIRISVDHTLPSTTSANAAIESLESNEVFGIYSSNDASVTADPTNSLRFETGNKTAGTGDSGDIVLLTGTSAGGTRGQVLLDGSQITIASDVMPDANFTRNFGTFANAFSQFYGRIINCVGSSGAFSALDAGGNVYGRVKGGFTPSGVANVMTLFSGDASPNGTCVFSINDASVDADPTGDLFLETGNKTAGTGNSGDVKILTGTSAGGTRGIVDIQNGQAQVSPVTSYSSTWWGSPTAALTFDGFNNTDIQNGGAHGIIWLGDNNTNWGLILTQDASGAIGTSGFDIATGAQSGSAGSGGFTIFTGESTGTAGASGGFSISSGIVNHTGAQGSGAIQIETGNVSNPGGSGNSGNIVIKAGNTSGSGNTGNISLQTGASAGGTRGIISMDALSIDHTQSPSENVVWETGATGSRPAGPVTGQRFFDTTLGIPIWFDGTNWVDANGVIV